MSQKNFSPQLIDSPGPYYHANDSTPRIMADVAIACLPAALCGWFFFGVSAFIAMLVCVIGSVGFEILFDLCLKRRFRAGDCSALVTGLLLAFVLPPAVPWYVCVTGSFVAIVIIKGLFGGLGKNIFNPALAARAFLVVLFPIALSSYSAPIHAFLSFDATTAATPLSIIKTKGIAAFASGFGDAGGLYLKLLIGDRGGCIGETSALALVLGGVYMMARRIISWHTPVAMIATAGLIAFLTGGHMSGVIVHVLSGGLMLGAFFMATDYVTAPQFPFGKIIFGIGCGAILMVIRLWGTFPEGCMFGILIMNIFTPVIDRYTVPKPFGAVKQLRPIRASVLSKEPSPVDWKVLACLGLCPPVAAAIGLREALLMGTGILSVYVLTFAVARSLRHFLLPSFSPFFIVAAAGGFTAAWALACRALFPELFSSISFYAYLMPIALPVIYSAMFPRRGGRPANSFLLIVAAMTLILCLVGAFREIIGSGALFGAVVARPTVPWVKTVPGGLATLALFTGVFGALSRRRGRGNRQHGEKP